METLRKATGTASRAFFGDDESRKSAGKGTSEKQVESGSQPPESESERQPEVERQLEPEKEPKYEQQPEPERGHEPPVERPPQSEPVSAPQQEQRDTKLKEHAATAALYHKEQPDAKPKAGKKQSVDEHRLSAAGAAASLKYAKAQDLPSYPVVGVSDKLSSAGAAASLANAHQKPFEHWKPDPTASASAAAMLAKDYKMAELWHPEQSSQGPKAAVLAAKEGANVKIWKPGSTDYGHSAALQAVRASEGLKPQMDYGYTADGRKGSLRASKLAMSSGRKRADSTPALPADYPDSINAGRNALNAANSAHGSHVPAFEREIPDEELPPSLRASRIHNVRGHVPREMFGSHPPVAIEVEEKKRQEALHSAAVSMAKQMYQMQQKTISNAAKSTPGADKPSGAMPAYYNLEEAAKKLAAERLAKLHVEHNSYRDYYGTGPPTHRLSLRGKGRRRASSMDEVDDDDDKAQSRRIRAEMSIFNKNIAEVDTKKRQKDREALLAAAQRNVRASMHNLDEKLFAETGRIPPSMMQEWEAKAKAAAEADSKARMANYGKVNIGGGKFVDQGEVEAVASRNVQPLLDEINDKAELHRAKEEEARLDREQAKREAQDEKAREKEYKMEWKKIKDHNKGEERARKQAEKAKKAEEKRRAKEEKRKLKEASKKAASGAGTTTTEPEVGNVVEVVAAGRQETEDTSSASSLLSSSSEEEAVSPEVQPRSSGTTEQQPQIPVMVETPAVVTAVTTTEAVVPKPNEPTKATIERPTAVDTKVAAAAGSNEPTTSPPTSPKSDSRVVSWIKDKFSRRASKSHKPEEPRPKFEDKDTKLTATGSSGEGAITSGNHGSSSSIERRDSSIRDVAMAGRASSSHDGAEAHADSSTAQPVVPHTSDDDVRPSRSRKRSPSPPVSPVSEELEDSDDDVIANNKGKDEEGARDRFDDDEDDDDDKKGLAPPPAIFAKRTSDSPVRDSKFLEDL